MMNKVIGIGQIASIAIAMLTGIFASSLPNATIGSLYGLSGLGFMVFGIWGGILLIKSKK